MSDYKDQARSSRLPSDKILIVRTSSMGDIIHAIPAVAALRKAFPEATIGWVVEERWAGLLCSPNTPRSGPRSSDRPLVERIHTVNTKAWRRCLFAQQTWRQIKASLNDLRSLAYPVVIDFQGALRSALIARFSGAETVYGFSKPREAMARMFYTRQVIPRGGHVIEQNCSLAEALTGSPLVPLQAEFPRDEAAEQECDIYLQKHEIDKFVLLNPGAGWRAKQWPAENYGNVARHFAETGVHCLINFGPGEEALAEDAEKASAGHARRISLSITQLIAFTRRAALFIGGDTGPMHLAAALGIPVVAIFGPTDPARNGPFAGRNIVLRNSTSQTSYTHRAQTDPGLLAIRVDEVVTAARQVLGNAQ